MILGDLVTRIFSFHISMKFFRKFIETIQVIHKKNHITYITHILKLIFKYMKNKKSFEKKHVECIKIFLKKKKKSQYHRERN